MSKHEPLAEIRIFAHLREYGTFIARHKSTKKSCDSLVEKGKAIAGDMRLQRWEYLLPEEWKKSEKKAPYLRAVQPDPPEEKINRPPALYSNRSHEELIDYILKSY
ncbi:MAG: hypothetical protein BGO55_00695 [Sphingobacteriales bacterium 50-39]|nr:hypothetical protein [Sphingobacteriales bacterium]OJW53633.1 MAG: hypothetical protein BGO55_00695 [Sphingobacteriales bacterium 50-39]